MRIAIIAAMEREVGPLIRGWKAKTIEYEGRRYRLFEYGETVLTCAGIGAGTARRATEALIRYASPQRVISAGFAGALEGSLGIGDIIEPRMVINAQDGVRTDTGGGKGILVSSANVAGTKQKAQLGKSYGAIAVDMEAASVAQAAQARGIAFAALKAISDAADFELPDLDRFVANDGNFRSAAFGCHVVLRPWLWKRTIALARNSSRAGKALAEALALYLERASNHRDELNVEEPQPIAHSG